MFLLQVKLKVSFKMTAIKQNYWIGVVSKSHVDTGVQGGFIQLNHGKEEPLKRMNAGDGLVFYSPRSDYPEGQILQHFTAIGIIKSDDIYQVDINPDFKPYRMNVTFFKCNEMAIKPLIHNLSFIKDKTRWGAAFRFGQIKIPREDFLIIARAMGVKDEF